MTFFSAIAFTASEEVREIGLQKCTRAHRLSMPAEQIWSTSAW